MAKFGICAVFALALTPALASEDARSLSLPRSVAEAGGLAAWNAATAESEALARMLAGLVQATSVEEALVEAR
ncbi:hypothetical protein T492DRAFT_861921 [Pavlovales sp. CCMP2436]|nr:hypothetical protein T492DRAFT_861921 [Pavlovales sp. CCMP2436]